MKQRGFNLLLEWDVNAVKYRASYRKLHNKRGEVCKGEDVGEAVPEAITKTAYEAIYGENWNERREEDCQTQESFS